MRQPGQENRVDPFEVHVPHVLSNLSLTPSDEAELKQWSLNTLLARQHKFCANQCVSFKVGAELQADEQNCIKTCFSKYSAAFSSYKNEQQICSSNLKDLEARGIDIFSARQI
jgi:hypothetical protein